MNDEDKKYLRSIRKFSPNLEVFNKMVRILESEQEKVSQLLIVIHTTLLKTSKTI